MSGCRIGKIKMKNGGAEVRIIPSSQDHVVRRQYPWGEVTFRKYNGDPITNGDMVWFLETVRMELLCS